MTPECARFEFVYKAHPPVHIKICSGGCNAVDWPTDEPVGWAEPSEAQQ
jgi:hypothetical protein